MKQSLSDELRVRHALDAIAEINSYLQIEKYRGLPVNMQVISCSMEDLSRNVKIITREFFKGINLEEMPT